VLHSKPHLVTSAFLVLFLSNCQSPSELSNPVSIGEAVEEITAGRSEMKLVPGQDLSTVHLRNILRVVPSHVLSILAGHRYRLKVESRIERKGKPVSSLIDSIQLLVDTAGDWRVDHSTRFENNDGQPVSRYRGCIGQSDGHFVSKGGERWTRIVHTAGEDESCLDTSFGWIRDLLWVGIDEITATVASTEDGSKPWVRIELQGLGTKDPIGISRTWNNGRELPGTSSVHGPRTSLLAHSASMESVNGHLVIHRKSGAIRSAEITVRFNLVKESHALMIVSLKLSNVLENNRVQTPKFLSIKPRQRVFRDMKKLLNNGSK